MIVIERRFRGPAESGQGGYTCGLLAREIDGAAQVTLRKPPPLESELTLESDDDGRRVLREADTILAEATPTTFEIATPPPVELSEAEAAVSRYLGFLFHPSPMCFGCGPERLAGDGLRLFPGEVPQRGLIACPWSPDPSLADDDGVVRPEFVWAALDCPTAFVCVPDAPMVLARLTGRLDRPLQAGRPHVITAWHLAREGRKHHSACAISTPAGQVIAVSQALWIEVKDSSFYGAGVQPP